MLEIIKPIFETLPNPDCFTSPDGLSQCRHEVKQAIEQLKIFASYCEAKEMAMQCRLAGKIELARKFEHAGEVKYNEIFPELRW